MLTVTVNHDYNHHKTTRPEALDFPSNVLNVFVPSRQLSGLYLPPARFQAIHSAQVTGRHIAG